MPETERASLLKEFWRIVFVDSWPVVVAIMAVILIAEYFAWRHKW